MTNLRTILNLAMSSKSSFCVDVMKLAGGTAIAQALTVLASPILTRLYGPEAFGLFALFTSITGIIGVIVCLRYELAIMLPKKDKEATNILALSLLLVGLISALTVPLVWFEQQSILRLLNAPGLSPYLWMVPLSVFVNGVLLAINYWNSRRKHFGSLSIARVISSLSATGTQLGAGFSGLATGGSLIVSSLAGSAISTLVLGWQIWWDNGRKLIGHINWRDMKIGFKRYRKFPIFDSWSALLNSISWQLPTFLLSVYFSSAVVGYYALSMMVLQLPTNLVGSAISQVFFQQAAEAKYDGTLSQVVESTFLQLARIGALPVVLLSITGKEIFIVIFGLRWAEAGNYTQILALWIFFVFAISPISTIFSVLEKQRDLLLFNIALFASRAGALVLGSLSGDPQIALMFFSVVSVVNYAGMGLWIFNKVDVPVSRILMNLGEFAVYCIFIIGLVALSKWIFLFNPQMILLLDTIITIIYYVLFIKKEGTSNQTIIYIKNHLF